VLFLGEGQAHLLAKKRVSFGIPRSPLRRYYMKNCPNFTE